ncbi:hypothetical protein HMPREF0178_00975, partial [Bilophila sp. 4_1_30]
MPGVLFFQGEENRGREGEAFLQKGFPLPS